RRGGRSRMARNRNTLEAVFSLARSGDLTASELRLWLLYRSYDSSGEGSFVYDPDVAKIMGVKERSVRSYRSGLIEKGFLELVRRRGDDPPIFRTLNPLDRQTVATL